MTMANHSMNQVFIRTINTTLTSFIPVFAMLLFGGETLKDFAFAMAIGLVCGSYSSIAVATPLYAIWKTREPSYKRLAAKYGDEVGKSIPVRKHYLRDFEKSWVKFPYPLVVIVVYLLLAF